MFGVFLFEEEHSMENLQEVIENYDIKALLHFEW
jgi:hypothetical protein